MKSRKIKALISVVLTLVMLFGITASATGAITYSSESGKYSLTKLTHPTKGSGEVDGIVDYVGNGAVSANDEGQGDRGQNYAWAAAGYGDYIYVSSNYNSLGLTLGFMDSVLGHEFDAAQMNAMLDVMYNGHFYTGEPDGANTGGVLSKLDTNTGEVKILMCASEDGNSVQLRNCCVFKDKIYFCGSVNGLPKIIEVDPANNDKCTIIYEGINPKDYYAAYLEGICTGIRGLTAFGDYLIVSMVTLDGPQILISSDPSAGQEAFTLIADQEDLFDYPAYHFPDSIYGGSIWEMEMYNDSLYVSICTGTPDNMPDHNTMQSFAIVRGDMGESFDEWTWTPVIGDLEDGAKYTFGIDPERTRAGAGVLHVYDDYLYIGEYNDEEIPLERILFETDFGFMNANLEQSVNLYRMDKDENIEMIMGDPTEMFPEGGISGIGSGFGRHENQYIWRMCEYNGRLYVGTFDTSSLLQPIAQFTNGDLLTMSVSDWARLLGFVKTLLEISTSTDEDTEAAKSLFESFSVEELAALFAELDIAGIIEKFSDSKAIVKAVKAVWEIIEGVLECSKYTCTADRGFDLYVTEDGVNFKTITTNGLGDPYNHGLRSFAVTDNGLMVGTANPFYAAQVWLLEADDSIVEENKPASGIYEIIFEKLVRFIKAWISMIMESFAGLWK